MPSRETADLTVVIPTWNRWRLLRHCLRSLASQTIVPTILVVDNGSDDETPTLLRSEFEDVEYCRLSSNQGFARAVNAGIRETRSRFVALLNNDTEADPRWVEEGLNGLREFPQCSLFASRMINFHQRHLLDSAGDCYSASGLPTKRGLGQPIECYSQAREVTGVSAGAAFYRRSLFDDVGLFDEDFYMYLEDVELSLRSRLFSHRCMYLPGATVYHIEAASDPDRSSDARLGGASVYYSASRVYWITRNRWLLMIMYQPWGHCLHLTCGWARSALFHLFKAGFSRQFMGGLWAGLRATPRALQKRRRMRRQMRITRKDLWKLFRLC